MQLGSKGVSTETEALIMTPMAKERALAPMVAADCMATGSTTSAAAAFDMGWVRMTVSTQNDAKTAKTPSGCIRVVMASATIMAAPELFIASPKASMPPMRMRRRQSMFW